MRLAPSLWAGCFALFCACSSTEHAAPDANGTTDEDGGTAEDAGEMPDTGPPFEPRQPCTTDDDCEIGATRCVQFGEDGPSTCHIGTLEPMACQPNVPQECCDDADCSDARCIGLITSPVECSSTAGFDFRNRCLDDECTSDADCQSTEICAPAGFGDVRECIFALCRTDADCTAEPGGACVVLSGGCCVSAIGGGPSRPPQLACTYPSDGCQLDTDCDEGQWCTTSSSPGRARCSSEC